IRCGIHFFVFFFSSRRRHTRSYGDWSSDVCSSDLIRKISTGGSSLGEDLRGERVYFEIFLIHHLLRYARFAEGLLQKCFLVPSRSEERRVGKECRFRWSR